MKKNSFLSQINLLRQPTLLKSVVRCVEYKTAGDSWNGGPPQRKQMQCGKDNTATAPAGTSNHTMM